MGGYGLSRGGWLQLVMVLLAALLAYGFLRAGLQIAGCQGAFPAAHGLLAAITGVAGIEAWGTTSAELAPRPTDIAIDRSRAR